MLPVAIRVGHTADTWGRKPILLIGVQLLDGIGAGIFGAITPLVLADLMRETGRYNVAQGVVAMTQGIGASTSGVGSPVWLSAQRSLSRRRRRWDRICGARCDDAGNRAR